MSNAPVFGMAVHLASLQIFHEANISKLREKSKQLTGFLEFVLLEAKKANSVLQFSIITPANPEERGAQLSLLTDDKGKALFDFLFQQNIIADWREPNVIRLAPAPLYNSFGDVYAVGEAFKNFPG
jgi:kynureninase